MPAPTRAQCGGKPRPPKISTHDSGMLTSGRDQRRDQDGARMAEGGDEAAQHDEADAERQPPQGRAHVALGHGQQRLVLPHGGQERAREPQGRHQRQR